MSAQSTSDFSNLQKYCKYCKKKVAAPLECRTCKATFHPSCGQQAGAANSANKVICCENVSKSEVKLQKPIKKSEIEEIQAPEMDEKKLKNIIKESFQMYLNPVEKKMDQKFKDLENAVQFMSDSFEEQKKTFESIITEVKTLRKENEALKDRIQLLEAKFDEIEVRERSKNIVIEGVPKQSNPDIGRIVRKITQGIGMNIVANEFVEGFRIGKKDDGPIIVRFADTQTKKEILRNIRKQKGTTVSKCGLEGLNNKIYLNEDLPVNKRNLFKKVRDWKREKGYKAAFCVNGNIYLKKTELDEPIKIRMESDLGKE